LSQQISTGSILSDFIRITGNLKEWNRWANLSNIHIPTLLMGAKYDIIDPGDIKKIAQLLPNAEVFIFQE
jgi:proline iminopeptidase